MTDADGLDLAEQWLRGEIESANTQQLRQAADAIASLRASRDNLRAEQHRLSEEINALDNRVDAADRDRDSWKARAEAAEADAGRYGAIVGHVHTLNVRFDRVTQRPKTMQISWRANTLTERDHNIDRLFDRAIDAARAAIGGGHD